MKTESIAQLTAPQGVACTDGLDANHPKRLLAWCRKELPKIRNCGVETRARIIKSMTENGLLEDCKHEHAHLVQSASGNESWYECDACGEVL